MNTFECLEIENIWRAFLSVGLLDTGHIFGYRLFHVEHNELVDDLFL